MDKVKKQAVDVSEARVTIGEAAERAGVPAQAPAASPAAPGPETEEPAEPERHAVLVGYGVKTAPTTRRVRKAPPGVAAAAARPATAEIPAAPAVVPAAPPEVPDDPGVPALRALAGLAGSAQAREHGRLANENLPRLLTHDRYGNRVDEVEFHPSWHWLLGHAVQGGLHAAPWVPGAAPGAHVARAAGFYLWSQVEAGHACPISMTYASVPALRHAPELARRYAQLFLKFDAPVPFPETDQEAIRQVLRNDDSPVVSGVR